MTQMNHGLQKGDLALPFAPGKSIAINNHFDSPCSRHLYKGDAGHDGLDWAGRGRHSRTCHVRWHCLPCPVESYR